MSLETRSTSALFKRAEQLKRWQESETSREPNEPKHKTRKIQFTDGCVFLASCAASDRDEVDRLLRRGADIDTANVDGLTALHQVFYISIFFAQRQLQIRTPQNFCLPDLFCHTVIYSSFYPRNLGLYRR